MDQHTQEVLRTCLAQGAREQLTLGALGLGGECGDVIDAIKKHLYGGHDLDSAHLLQECGDVLWYLTLVLQVLGYTLDDAIAANIEKMHRRYPDGFDLQRSLHRPTEDH